MQRAPTAADRRYWPASKNGQTASALTGGQRAAGSGRRASEGEPTAYMHCLSAGKKDGEGERGEKGGGRQLMEIADARGADGSAVDIYEVALL